MCQPAWALGQWPHNSLITFLNSDSRELIIQDCLLSIIRVISELERYWRPSIATRVLSVLSGIIGHTFERRIVRLEHFVHKFSLFLFLCGKQPSFLPFLFIQDLLQMSLSLQIELFYSLTVVHGFGIDLFIAHDDTLPNGFIGFLEGQYQRLAVLHWPERVFHLHFLTKVTVY